MTNEEILALKDEADEIMSRPGNTKGNSLLTDVKFIEHKEGREGVKRLEEALTLLGYPFVYEEVRAYDWYPESQTVLGIYLAKKIFGWRDSDVFDMGYAAPATSIIVKTLMRFISLETTFKQAPSVWEKHYDFGQFKIGDFDAENKRLTFSVSGYGYFDYMKEYFDGFFKKVLQLVGVTNIVEYSSSWCSEEGDMTCRKYEVRW